ncbi:MAG: cation diffusion facilitator family transporter, partial [Azoarcus sp.]|nr:cation diffusion facilitator family transporter [Azoarcus sp.]
MTTNPTSIAENAARGGSIRRVTLLAIATNAALTLGQIAVGLFAHAFSLVADAAHTLSDLVTDFMVLVAGQRGANPADLDHPYGHGRIETATSLLLGATLVAVGVGFLWTSGQRLQNMDMQSPLHPAALAMALVTLAAKEILFRFTLAASRRLKAPLLEANAWHQRSDAASSLVVAIGIGGSLAGYPFLEPLAAAVVGFLILRMGLRLAWGAVSELIDTGLSPEELEKMRQTIAATPGVAGLHELRTRRMA